MKRSCGAFFLRYGLILVGCILAGGGFALFLSPNSLAPGGASGIALILNHFVPAVSTGTWVICLNVPLLIAGAIKFGKRFLCSTLFATVLFSLSIDGTGYFLHAYIPLTDDLFLASLFGGLISACGLGLVFRCGSTTGGTDIIVKLLRAKFRHIRTGALFFVVDMTVAVAGGIVFGEVRYTLYAAVTILVSGFTMDFVIYGGNEAKLVFIVSDAYAQIAARILKGLDVGATFLDGRGAYTNAEKQIVLVAIKKHECPKLRDLVTQLDPHAFMIVSSAREIYGEGFLDHTQEDV